MSLAKQLLAVLDDPTHMWSHALKESSPDSQRLFLTLPLLPQPVSTDELQAAYSTQVFSQAEPFLDSLRSLEDSFISIDIGSGNRRWVNFRNPSLQDFSHEYLNRYSDWLSRLLSAPAYYEQIANVYSLAMSRFPSERTNYAKSQRRPSQQGELKFIGIRSWIMTRHQGLLATALNLALSVPNIPARYYQYEQHDLAARLRDLVEIILTFGEPSDDRARQSLTTIIQRALRPASKPDASIMFDLLRVQREGELIQRYFPASAMDALRTNILDKDEWKFALLSQIDEFLEIEAEDSMGTWGHDYVNYVDKFVAEVSESSDYEEYSDAIDELRSISSLLGVDLYDSISMLEARRDGLPLEEDSGNYESYASKSEGQSSSPELDDIFASLLEG